MSGIIFNIIFGISFMFYLLLDAKYQYNYQDIAYRICLIYIINVFVMFNLVYLIFLVISGF